MSRAVIYREPGGIEVLALVEVPDSALAAAQVAVTIGAAGLNPFDTKARSGFLALEIPFPRRIGMEFAGAIESVGVGATYWDGAPIRVGDPVLGWGLGGIAERIVVPASQIARLPLSIGAEVAASLPTAALTSLQALRVLPVGEGETVLLGGAAGAVGIVYAQLAIARGARVIGTASVGKHDFLRSIGVVPIQYGEGLIDRVEAVSKTLGEGRITAVQDNHGREALDVGVALGVPRDRISGIAGYGAIAELDVLSVGPFVRDPKDLEEITMRVASGSMTIPIAATYSLEHVGAAFAAFEAAHAVGKIVIIP
ncbi:MAG: NADP-dependent oxidoreductase [Salinibacterium sp.]|nr:NADP-dependent oxidoreductase [Salinibacterium sp.]